MMTDTNDNLTIAVRANYLAAAATFRSFEETRYYLNGVCIERGRKGGGINLLATDGHHGAIIRDVEGLASWDSDDVCRIISTPPDLLKQCRSKAREAYGGTRWVVITARAAYVVLAADAKDAINTATESTPSDLMLFGAFGSMVINATYPDFRRVCPPRKVARSKIATCFGLNTSLLANFSTAASLLSGTKDAHACIRGPVDGTGPFWVATNSPDLIGVLMPMRCHDEAVVLGMAKDIIDAPVGKAPPTAAKPKRPKLISAPKPTDGTALVAIAA